MAKKKAKKAKAKNEELEKEDQQREREFVRMARPLDGKIIGISISEADDIEHYGYRGWDVNRVTVRLSEALLNAGAHLVFGHDWRPDGLMTAICGMAIKSHSIGDGEAPPLIQNFLAHPDKTNMSTELKRDLRQRDLVRIRTIDPPKVNGGLDPELERALALSHMRFVMNSAIDARICIGGKRLNDQTAIPAGFFSGVAEEAYWAAKTGKPLLVAGFLGGVTAELIRSTGEKGKLASDDRGFESLAVVEQKKELHQRACEMLKTRKYKKFELPPADLKPTFDAKVLGVATKGLWDKGCQAVDVDSFAAIVRQLKFSKQGNSK